MIVWDLNNNTSQEWQNTSSESTHYTNGVTSLSFHPTQDLLCIAINNQIHFWNWRKNTKDLCTIGTGNLKQKIRFIRFDSKGRLITGISNDLYSKFNLNNFSNLGNLGSGLNNHNLNNNLNSSSTEQQPNNLNNLNNNLIDQRARHATNNQSFGILRSEALFNQLANSIATDQILQPESNNQTSYSFLQRQNTTTNQQQTTNVPTSLFNRLMNLYRGLDNNSSSETAAATNDDDDAIANDDLNSDSSSRSNESTSNDTNDEELNVIMESTNIVERLVNRYRSLIVNSESTTISNSINFLSARNQVQSSDRDYFLRRRLSRIAINLINNRQNTASDRFMEQVIRDRQSIHEARNTRQNVFNITTTNQAAAAAAASNVSSNSEIINTMNDAYQRHRQFRLSQEFQRSLSFENSFRENSNLNSNSLRSNLSSANLFDRLRISRLQIHASSAATATNRPVPNETSNNSQETQSSPANNNNNLTTEEVAREVVANQDNHNRFYRILQHQAIRQASNREESTSSSTHPYSETTANSTAANQITTLIGQIQNSINSINQLNVANNNRTAAATTTTATNSLLANEEIQQLSTSGHALLQRLINYTNYREKLINLKNRIRLMLLDNSYNSTQSSRIDLANYHSLVSILIDFTYQMQRILATDLRFTQISRLYLMGRQTTIDNLNRSTNENNSSSLEQQPTSSGSSGGSDKSTSNSQDNNTAIPSTSSGITKKRKQQQSFDNETEIGTIRNAKKFKIPNIRISNNEESSVALNTNEIENQTTPASTSTTTADNSTSSRDQLRSEINNLLTNLETLTERLSNGQQNRLSNQSNALNYFGLQSGHAIHRINNSIFNLNQNNNNINNPTVTPPPPPHTAAANTNPINQWIYYNDFNQLSNENLSYRIQCFDLKAQDQLPSLNKIDASNLICRMSRINNDSSIDISKDGEKLCCLVPIDGSNEVNLCVYSIKKSTLGHCLFVYCSFNSNAISVSFSPSSQYVLIGFQSSSRLYNSTSNDEQQVEIAQIFLLSESLKNMVRELNGEKLDGKRQTKAVELIPIKSVYAARNDDFFSLNSIKWFNRDCGLIYGTNNGQLVICKASDKLESWYSQHMSNRTINKQLNGQLNGILFSSISPRSSNLIE